MTAGSLIFYEWHLSALGCWAGPVAHGPYFTNNAGKQTGAKSMQSGKQAGWLEDEQAGVRVMVVVVLASGNPSKAQRTAWGLGEC